MTKMTVKRTVGERVEQWKREADAKYGVPVTDAALREMLGECATDSVDRYIADGCTASEAASAAVSRLLGGGK